MRAMVERRCAIAITVLPSISVEELLLDRDLDLAVERRGRLVEHQDRRVLQDHARERDALALAARELHAALADVRVVAGASVPVAQPDDELVRLRLARRRVDLVVARARAGRSGCWRRSSDAAATCPASPCRSPRAGSPASRRAMSWPSIRMRPCFELVEAQQQVHERRLAGARAADEADALARPDREVEIVEHRRRVGAAVAEGEVLEADLAARRPRAARAPARSTPVCGTAIVCMPSCTTPMFSKMPVTSQLTQPGDVRRSATRAAARSRRSPALIAPCAHSAMPIAAVPTSSAHSSP